MVNETIPTVLFLVNMCTNTYKMFCWFLFAKLALNIYFAFSQINYHNLRQMKMKLI